MAKWTEKDILFLKENYCTLFLHDIVMKLNKSDTSVASKAMRLKLKISKAEKLRRIKEGLKNLGDQSGKNNHNWKGGISKDYYHYKKIQQERYPIKVKARAMVCKAVTSGKIERLPCRVCGELKTEAHHEDYKKPLDVIWLCKKCHREHHSLMK